jgi:hypothetical protein
MPFAFRFSPFAFRSPQSAVGSPLFAISLFRYFTKYQTRVIPPKPKRITHHMPDVDPFHQFPDGCKAQLFHRLGEIQVRPDRLFEQAKD